jgi:hypothetical protein
MKKIRRNGKMTIRKKMMILAVAIVVSAGIAGAYFLAKADAITFYGPPLTVNSGTKQFAKYPDDFNYCTLAQSSGGIGVFDCGAWVIVASTGTNSITSINSSTLFTITDPALRPPIRQGSGGFSHGDLVGFSLSVETNGNVNFYRGNSATIASTVSNNRIMPFIYPKNQPAANAPKNWAASLTVNGVTKDNLITKDIIGGAAGTTVTNGSTVSWGGVLTGAAFDWGGMVSVSYMSANCGTISANSNKTCGTIPAGFRPTHTVGAVATCHNLRGASEPWGVSVNIFTTGEIQYYNGSLTNDINCDNTHLTAFYANTNNTINWIWVPLTVNGVQNTIFQADKWGPSARSDGSTTGWGTYEKQFTAMAQNRENANLGSTPWNATTIGTFPWPLKQNIYVPIFCHHNFGAVDPISGYFSSLNISANGTIQAWDTGAWFAAHTNCRAPLYLPAASI